MAIQVNADIVIFNSMVVYGSHVRNLYGFSVKDQMNTEVLFVYYHVDASPWHGGNFIKVKYGKESDFRGSIA